MTYYYEHTNGTIITKPDIVVDLGGGPYEYFDSPFVKRWWYKDNKKKTRQQSQEDAITALDNAIEIVETGLED